MPRLNPEPRLPLEPERIVALARAAMMLGNAALAAGSLDGAIPWLERAHRLVPGDPNVRLSLASIWLDRDAARAEALFGGIAESHDVRQAWLGLAAARGRLNRPAEARAALSCALARHALRPDTAAFADQISGGQGWWPDVVRHRRGLSADLWGSRCPS